MNSNKKNNTFSNNLKKQIKLNGMTNKELAKLLGVTPSTITSYLNGDASPRMDKLEKLCEIFNITKAQLLEEDYLYKKNPLPSSKVCESSSFYSTYKNSIYFRQLIDNIKSLYETGALTESSIIDLNLIIDSFKELNALGQAELAKRSNEMTEISKFSKTDW